ncbi:MAG: P1 family peptidase [Bryobacteraceae bacterium]|nr:P1 family peptidase [Bryobacteraceae bacterium]
MLSSLCLSLLLAQNPSPRARDLGLRPGQMPTGTWNSITDVPGVKVGHTTLIEGENVRTGVTAILPHGGNLFADKVAGAVFTGNGFGKLAGALQVQELGVIETPIVLTNTLSVGTAIEAVVAEALAANPAARSVNALVGETNDGGLNDIRGMHVKREHVVAAMRGAAAGPVAEGSVGAGTGTIAFGWKGGIGTSSRRIPGGYTLGVLVQTNYGGALTMGGVRVGEALKASQDGSCMIVVATDAPIDARDLGRIAARAVFGLARTGSSYSNGSGDFAIAFSTAMRSAHGNTQPVTRTILPPDAMSPFFAAALEATEEAVYNSLLQAKSVGGKVEVLPLGRVKQLLERQGIRP